MTERSTGGTLDGGDVLFTGTEIFVGISKRTNRIGAKILQEFFSEYPVHTIDLLKFPESLHLKSACSICGPGALVVGGIVGKYIQDRIIAYSGANKYRFFPTEDMYAANCLYLNDVLIRRHLLEFPASAVGFKSIDDFVVSSGGTVVEIEADELAKLDGALTCCSLLIDL
jgi:N-dimethylarginine dimethylaminohydrolase